MAEILHAVVPWKQGGRYTLDEAVKVYKRESAADAYARKHGGNLVVRSFDKRTGEQTFGRKNPPPPPYRFGQEAEKLPPGNDWGEESDVGTNELSDINRMQQDAWPSVHQNPVVERLEISDGWGKKREVRGYQKAREWFYEDGTPIEVGGVAVTMIKGYRDNPVVGGNANLDRKYRGDWRAVIKALDFKAQALSTIAKKAGLSQTRTGDIMDDFTEGYGYAEEVFPPSGDYKKVKYRLTDAGGAETFRKRNPHGEWREWHQAPGNPRTWLSADAQFAIEDRGGSFTLYSTEGMGKQHDYWMKKGDYGDFETAKRRAQEHAGAFARSLGKRNPYGSFARGGSQRGVKEYPKDTTWDDYFAEEDAKESEDRKPRLAANPREIHFDGEQIATTADTAAFLRNTIGMMARDAKDIAMEMKIQENRKKMGGNPGKILREISQLSGAFGVEGIWEGDGELSTRSQFGEIPLAEYVNTGDTYNPTVLYDYSEGKFYLTTYGDWVEKYEREHA